MEDRNGFEMAPGAKEQLRRWAVSRRPSNEPRCNVPQLFSDEDAHPQQVFIEVPGQQEPVRFSGNWFEKA